MTFVPSLAWTQNKEPYFTFDFNLVLCWKANVFRKVSASSDLYNVA